MSLSFLLVNIFFIIFFIIVYIENRKRDRKLMLRLASPKYFNNTVVISVFQVEHDLVFLGFMIMQNTLKPETSPVIAQLHMAKIRCVMVTGNHSL